jgi:hypothetical protein
MYALEFITSSVEAGGFDLTATRALRKFKIYPIFKRFLQNALQTITQPV